MTDCQRCNGPLRHQSWPNPDGRGVAETPDDEAVSVLDEEDDEC